jgi:hypothetical protein
MGKPIAAEVEFSKRPRFQRAVCIAPFQGRSLSPIRE